MTDTAPRALAHSIIDRIDWFEFECKQAEHTDTDEAWRILHAIRDELADLHKLPPRT